ncbi:hypothetical protein J4217_04215 [Candidatus Pacearchaeota archaeon]|nr:hypothetical protein [Candidatus Pacearchaeota archaeon]
MVEEKKIEKVREAKFCPKCESENIGIEASVSESHDYCLDCGLNFSGNGVVGLVSFPVKTQIIKEKK